MQLVDDTRNLNDWLSLLESQHETRDMTLGLDRMYEVGGRLGCLAFSCPVITVAGTNGKGTTVALLEATLGRHYRVGALSSPHLLHFSERIRVNGQPVSDEDICQAFARVQRARGDISLSFFEFITLAALLCYQQAALDVLVLEVGLGGRLDAVNAVDPTLAIITTIDFDHEAWLGSDREQIGFEKAGIMRAQTPVVCGDRNTPQSVKDHAHQLHAPLYCQQRDFHYQAANSQWQHSSLPGENLPLPNIPLDNASSALQGLSLLQSVLPVPTRTLKKVLQSLHVPGRLQWLLNVETPTLLDVAHNAQAAAYLAEYLQTHPISGHTYAVFANLETKSLKDCVAPMLPFVDQWFVGALSCEHASRVSDMRNHLKEVSAKVIAFNSVKAALHAAEGAASSDDRIVVFGSFHTVAEVLSGC